ncbi:MAG: hypothetical protein KDD39_14835 [Bdellovibrionales bacterium]|nr:hypothetical protein [Bdellovibrionales bacterium]
MTLRSYWLFIVGLVFLTFFMTACRTRNSLLLGAVGGGPNIALPGDSATCSGPIQGSLIRVSPTGTVNAGQAVTWRVDVHQFDGQGIPCRGDYYLSRAQTGSEPFDGLEEYTTDYPVPNNLQVEEVTVFSASNPSLSLNLASAAFIVAGGSTQASTGEAQLSCDLAAIPNSRAGIATAPNGIFRSPLSLSLDVVDRSAPGQNLLIVRATEFYFENGVQKTRSIPFPTTASNFHRIPVTVDRPFEHSFVVEVTSANTPGRSASCAVLAQYLPEIPDCTLSASPNGDKFDFNFGVAGYHTSLFFDGVNVTGTTRLQLPGLQAPGRHEATVVVAGVGQKTCSTVVDPIVAPTCTLNASANSVQQGTDFNLTVRVDAGTANTFLLSGGGVASPSASTSVVHTANLSPTTYQYTARVTDVYGQSGSCWKNVQVTAPPPPPTCSISVVSAPNPIRVNDWITLRLTRQNSVGHTLSGPNLTATTQTEVNVQVPNTAGDYDYLGIVFAANGVQGNCSKRVSVLPPPGQWYSLSSPQDCAVYCAGQGKQNVPSPEGHKCASGELIPQSAIGVVNFRYGCWRDCNPHGAPDGQSYKKRSVWYCYGTGQKRDSDRTDRIVGCFCR